MVSRLPARSSNAGVHAFTENRSVLVKVIQAADDVVKDRIIQATNSQTALGSSALRPPTKCNAKLRST